MLLIVTVTVILSLDVLTNRRIRRGLYCRFHQVDGGFRIRGSWTSHHNESLTKVQCLDNNEQRHHIDPAQPASDSVNIVEYWEIILGTVLTGVFPGKLVNPTLVKCQSEGESINMNIRLATCQLGWREEHNPLTVYLHGAVNCERFASAWKVCFSDGRVAALLRHPRQHLFEKYLVDFGAMRELNYCPFSFQSPSVGLGFNCPCLILLRRRMI